MKRTPLARRTPLKSRSPIRARGKKRARENRVRNKIRKEYSDAQTMCERCGVEPAVDLHERLTRGRGGSITDRSNLVALDRSCHQWLTEHPRQAVAEGFVVHSWDAS